MSNRISLADKMRRNQATASDESASDALKSSLKDALSARKSAASDKASSLAARIQQKSESVAEEAEDAVAAMETLGEEAAAELQERVDSLRERYNELISRVQLTDIISETESLGTTLETLPDEIQQIRNRGYTFHSYLENKVVVLAERWDEVNDRIEDWLEKETADLEDELAAAASHVTSLSGDVTSRHSAIARKLEAVLDDMDNQVSASEERIQALYGTVEREVHKTKSQLSQISKQLDWLEAASFELDPTEGLFIAAEAEWVDDRDKPDGYLFVTNQRMIFEQNEKTGKRLGMFGGKQTQEVLWETPLSAIEKVTGDNQGMFGGKDMMQLELGAGAPYAEITCEIKGGIEADFWAQQVQRAAKGYIAKDSTVEPDPELIERLRNAPTDCPNCGGVLPELSAGDTEVTCIYCGTVIRI
jgi:predicted nuclease with TOPRIM domain